MTNAEIIATIRNEIERLKGYYRITNPYDKRAIRVCENLLSFLSTLESEKPMREGLDEEISRYLREECSDDDEPSISDTARHFAQWGAEHAKK